MKIKLLSVTVSLYLISCGPIWRSPQYYLPNDTLPLNAPLLTAKEYSERAASHPRPYVVSIPERALLFGAEHTKDPHNEQIDSITAVWKRFRPTVALVEGRLGFLFRWISDPVEHYGESGLVYDLAKRDGIPCYSWEPPFEKEIIWMSKKFSQKRIALFYILRPYFGQVKFQKPSDPNEYVEKILKRRTKINGLEGSIRNIAEIDSMWKADFSGSKNWRDMDDRYGWIGYLNDIGRESNAFRDEHFARVVITLSLSGEKVFAVCGSSHAVKLENTLRSAFNKHIDK